LATLNAVSDPTALRIGQTLRLPVSTKAPVTTANPTVRVSRITDLSTNTPEPTSTEPPEETEAAAPVSGKTASETKPAAKEEPAPQPPKTVPGTRMIWPANGKILSDFSANGKGLDIGGVEGDLVVAAGAGTVLFVGENVKGYGNLVIIKHSDSIVTAYGHNRKIVVKTNDRVKAGQKIAEMGSNNGVPQVRFEVRLRGKAVNPSEYLPARR
jgi:lipoprotein NlpD